MPPIVFMGREIYLTVDRRFAKAQNCEMKSSLSNHLLIH